MPSWPNFVRTRLLENDMTDFTENAPTHLEDMADRIRPKAMSNLLLWLVLGFVVLFIIWAAVVQLDRTVHAQGRVIASGRMQVVSNLEGGIIQAILVKPGDTVKRGQPLVRLDKTAPGAELGANQITVDALAVKVARLESEIAGRDPVYPAARTPADVEQLQVERSLHAARLADLASLTSQGQARAAQAERAVAEARAVYASKTSARDSAQRQLDMVRPLVERGIEPQVTLVQLQNQASVSASEAAQASETIARSQAAVREALAGIAQARQNWRAQAGTDLATAQAERASRSSTNSALADRVRRTMIVAPVDGRVNRVLVTTVGASIGPGQPIAEVVPSASSLTIEATVSPKDIAAIRIGQRAKVNITAYEAAIYGGMDAHVVTISPDATIEERTGESHYTVRLEGDPKGFRDPYGQRLPIGPGMTADVNLIGDKRSVLAYILTPFTRLREDALRE